jgi:hypothetical protein
MTHGADTSVEAPARRKEWGTIALGLVVFVFGVASWTIEGPDQPSAQDLRDFYSANRRGLALSACSGAVASTGLILLAASLLRLLRPTSRSGETLGLWVFGTAVVVGCLDTASAAIGFTPVVGEPATQSDDVLLGWYAMNRLSEAIGDLTTFPRAALLAAVGVAATRSRALPSWVGWYSLAVALLSLLGGLALTTLADPLSAAWLAALYGFALWPLVIAVGLTFRRRTVRTS